ncbi:MAG TPA: hypothetical protein VIJ93_08640 [bacterium]
MKRLTRPFFILFFLFTVQILNADYGSRFLVNARIATALDETQKKISYRVTCQEDMNVIAISFFCEEAIHPPAYLASVQEDANGKPSSRSLGSVSVVPRGKGWITLPVNELQLFKGTVYHLVLEQDTNRGGRHSVGIIGPRNYASFAYTDIPNHMLPSDEKPDPKAEVLAYEKGAWHELRRQPLYILHGSGSHAEGDPYDDFNLLPIHGNGTPNDPSDDVLQGECLHPHCGFNPTGFTIRVKKQGNPTSPLNYRVYANDYMHHKTTLAYFGEGLKPKQIGTSFQWVTIGLKKNDPTKGFPPECRYVVFQTDSGRAVSQGPGCEDCYLISSFGNSGSLAEAADLTFDGGAHLSRTATSTDGGANWIDEFESDSNVIILGPDCSSILDSQPAPPQPIPTPLSLLKGLIL